MFKIHLLRPLKQALTSRSSKEEWLKEWQDVARKGRNREYVTTLEGYQDAYAHFEAVINGMVRAKEINHDKIEGIEEVFRYFEDGRRVAEKAEENINKYKDIP